MIVVDKVNGEIHHPAAPADASPGMSNDRRGGVYLKGKQCHPGGIVAGIVFRAQAQAICAVCVC